MQRINYNPRMTRRLIEQGMFRSNNLVVMDAGARGGASIIWNFFGDQFRVIGFEPDAAECARINAEKGDGRHVFYPVALDRARGKRACILPVSRRAADFTTIQRCFPAFRMAIM